jgi:tetratricopeptide (TPR) repeat protein
MPDICNPGPGGPVPEPPDPHQVKSDEALEKSRKNTPDDEYQAIQEFEELLGTNDVADEIRMHAWQRLGCSYFKVKNYHAAISAFDKASGYGKNSPVTVNAHLQKGRALLKIRKPRMAREEFFLAQSTIKTLPGTVSDDEKIYLHATVLHQIGISLSQTGHDDEALDYFNQVEALYQERRNRTVTFDPHEMAIKVEKVHHTARVSKSFSLCRVGRLEEARKLIKKTISDLESPGNAPFTKYLVSAQNVVGIINMYDTGSENAQKEALSAFDKAIGIAKTLGENDRRLYIWKGYYNKGLALKSAEKFSDAIACFTEGLKESDEFEPHLMYARGITKIELQKYENGIQDLQEVQQFDPRFSPAIIALGDASRKQSIYFREVELQKQLLESTTAAVDTTQQNLKDLSDDMRSSLKHVSWMFYILFSVGMAVFLLSLYFAFRNASTLAETALANASPLLTTSIIPATTPVPDPMALAVAAIGGIDVILSMIFLSPTKIQKNRIDYSQWLMSYFNWVNTQFAASTVMLERLQNVHSPTRPATEEFNWTFAQPIYSFLHLMTKETLENIDKCCEFPDAKYSLSTKTETPPAEDAGAGSAAGGTKPGTGAEEPAEPEADGAAGAEPEKPAPEAKPAASDKVPVLPEGFDYISTGDKTLPGHTIKGADLSRGIPAVVFSCWKGAATDNRRYISLNTLQGEQIIGTGSKPEPLSRAFTVDEFSTKILNLFFAVIGYRDVKIHIGISFMYLDENGDFSTLPNSSDYIQVKKGDKLMYFVRYHDITLMRQDVYESGNQQVFINPVEVPHDHPIDKAVGKHYVTFRITEANDFLPEYSMKEGVQKKREIEWIWESEPFEYTVADKTS